MKKRFSFRIFAALAAVLLLLSSCAQKPAKSADTDAWSSNYKFVFVHGLSGWGSYDSQNKYMKYWGMRCGDFLSYLNEEGFDCYAASVDPFGSAWDRACELYAQLTGSVVDYGKEHSERCNHERFGTDYSQQPLIEGWSAEDKINLIGHSFGGATVRLFAELMANGSAAEQNATLADELSPLFAGGKEDWIYSVTCLASPHNGTTAYNVNDGSEDVSDELSPMEHFMSDMVGGATAGETDGRADYDYANYDLQIDNALALNENFSTLEGVYYYGM
jgi:triacylglycerol esterase/lipase EstA (alpha/beta hydrolase family)